MRIYRSKIIVILLGFIGTFWALQNVYAADASFFLSPETGVYTIGEEFPVSIMINTDGDPIVAVEGNITFNKNELEVVGLSKEGSILSSWVPEPEYSNEEGIIRFGGTVPTGEQFNGDGGRVLTVTFKALRNVASNVKFQTGAAILAANSGATNILTEMNSGVYTLNPQQVVPTIEYVAPANTETSNIISSTHPDQGKWYATTTASFSWKRDEGVDGLRLSFDAKAKNIPSRFYAEPITEKTIEGIGEGIWYLHMQTKNSSGWGEVSNFRVQIDVTDPKYFIIKNIERDSLTDPSPMFIFDAFDEVSGIDHYEIKLDGEEQDAVPANASSTETTYRLAVAPSGDHTLFVKAVDKAGNSIEQSTTFYVEAIPAPSINGNKEKVSVGEVIAIQGTAIPDSEIRIFVSKDGSEPSQQRVLSDNAGTFSYIMEAKEPGLYRFFAQTKNMYGAESPYSGEITASVVKPGLVVYGNIIIGYLSVIVPLVGLCALLIFLLWFGWHTFRSYKKRLYKEVDEAEGTLHREFAELKRATEQEIAALEKAQAYRRLTPEEWNILRHLKNSFSDAEKRVDKEFADIEKIANEKKLPMIEAAVHEQEKQLPPRAAKMQLKIEKLH